ncbi:MAG: cell division protein ZapA [bacterium]|nr:cell division protein ZapA [bacterium]
MKRYRITVLGRNCTIATDKDEVFMKKIENKINEELQNLRLSMPHADVLDLVIIYLFLLYEKIDSLEKKVMKMEGASSEAKRIIRSLQMEINKELTNLTRGNKI